MINPMCAPESALKLKLSQLRAMSENELCEMCAQFGMDTHEHRVLTSESLNDDMISLNYLLEKRNIYKERYGEQLHDICIDIDFGYGGSVELLVYELRPITKKRLVESLWRTIKICKNARSALKKV